MRGKSGGLRVGSGTERQRQGPVLSPTCSRGSEWSACPLDSELRAFRVEVYDVRRHVGITECRHTEHQTSVSFRIRDFQFLPGSYGVYRSDAKEPPSLQNLQEGPLLALPQAKDATLALHDRRREGK